MIRNTIIGHYTNKMSIKSYEFLNRMVPKIVSGNSIWMIIYLIEYQEILCTDCIYTLGLQCQTITCIHDSDIQTGSPSYDHD